MDREQFEDFLAQYQEIKRAIRMEDPTLYERWKAGGFLIDNDIISMYPCLEGMLEDDLLAFDDEDAEEEEEEEVDLDDGKKHAAVINHYRCPCGAEWQDQWDCACNDHCPKCNKEIEPYNSETINAEGVGA